MFAASKSGSADAKDSQFNYVTMLLHGDGTNGSQNNTFVDSSTNAFSITRNGNTTQGTFTPYGSNWSSYLGTNGNYFTSGTNAALGLSTGDWTIEFFLNVGQFVDNQFLIDFRPSGSGGATQPLIYLTTAGTLLYFTASATRITSSTGVITAGTWAHIAVSRASGSTRMFVNGVQTGSTYTDANDYGSSARFVNGTYGDAPGATNNNGGVISGYISNLRILKGTGLYTGSYTVPTSPLTAITNTSCLTFQSNRFIDNSSNSIAITPSGTPSVQRFSPFAPLTVYNPATNGGSAYFDGSGDYLNLASNSAFNIGTNSFCVEFWVYTSGFPTGGVAVGLVSASYNTNFHVLGWQTNIVRFYIVNSFVDSNAINLNAWNHIACVRNGTSAVVYINGVAGTATTLSGTGANSALYVGSSTHATSETFTGYLSNVRFVNGSAVYTSNFTPNAPLTAIANTSFLLSGTNPAILDNAMMNDLETVGNAQISTSVKKYGTGSMYFDGAGDGLIRPVSNLFDFGSGNFTVEFWANCVSTSGYGFFASVWEDSGGSDANSSWLIRLDNGVILTHFMQGSGTYNILTSSAISTNTWFHFAWVKNSTTQTMYINGTSVASGTVTGSMNTAIRSFRVGYQGAATNYLNGYIDDLRITKGVARYTANFTAPTTAFADKG